MEFCAKALIQPLLLSPSLFPSSSCTQSIIRKMILDIILCGLFRCTMVLLWYRWRRIITWFALINWQFVTSYNWRIWWNWPTFFSPFSFHSLLHHCWITVLFHSHSHWLLCVCCYQFDQSYGIVNRPLLIVSSYSCCRCASCAFYLVIQLWARINTRTGKKWQYHQHIQMTLSWSHLLILFNLL